MLTVVRREEKYPLSIAEAYHFSFKFSQLLKTDAHSANGTYKVRSLYFDSLHDKDFFDKINEQNNRKKIRLRIYHPSDSFAKLEMKQKENIYQKKRSLLVTRSDAIELMHANYNVLLKYTDPFALEMFSVMNEECYRPKSIVEYERKAFMTEENNIRLTFDSHIQATETNLDLFSEQLNMYPVYNADQVIFEVKYDRFMLGYISEIISTINRRNVSSSKYCLSRSQGYPLY